MVEPDDFSILFYDRKGNLLNQISAQGSSKSIEIDTAGRNGFRIKSNDWHSVGDPVTGKTQVQADGTLKVVPF